MNLRKFICIVSSLSISVLLLLGVIMLMNSTVRSVCADPADYFVVPSGSGDCSRSSPCNQLTALSTTGDGDTIYFAAGEYTGAAVITVAQSVALYGGWDGPRQSMPDLPPPG